MNVGVIIEEVEKLSIVDKTQIMLWLGKDLNDKGVGEVQMEISTKSGDVYVSKLDFEFNSYKK